MAEQALSSDRETILPVPSPQPAPTEEPRAPRRPWSWITLVRLAVLIAGVSNQPGPNSGPSGGLVAP